MVSEKRNKIFKISVSWGGNSYWLIQICTFIQLFSLCFTSLSAMYHYISFEDELKMHYFYMYTFQGQKPIFTFHDFIFICVLYQLLICDELMITLNKGRKNLKLVKASKVLELQERQEPCSKRRSCYVERSKNFQLGFALNLSILSLFFYKWFLYIMNFPW